MNKLKAGIIGYGVQGKRHAKAYSELDKVHLTAISDLDEKNLEKASSKYRCPETFKNYKEMLEGADIQAVSITTPDYLHKKPVIDSLKAGKHVLCEKPLATKLKDIEAMIETWRKSNVKFMTCFENRWNPPFRNSKQIIEKGNIGEIKHIHAKLNGGRDVPINIPWVDKTSPALFLGVHIIDLCRWFTNSEISSVVAQRCSGVLEERDIETSDAIQSLVKCDNGTRCTLESNWILPESFPSTDDFEFTILGSEGRLEINPTKQAINMSTTNSYSYPWVFRHTTIDGHPYGFVPGMVKHFVESVLENKDPLTSPYDGKAATEIALAMQESIDKGKVIDVKG